MGGCEVAARRFDTRSMLTLSSTLEAHQQGSARRPYVSAIAGAHRFGIPLLPWTIAYGGDGEGDDPYEYSDASHPIRALHLASSRRPTNWTRVQGPDRYADAHDFEALYLEGPTLDIVRNLDADDDAKAEAYASNVLLRQPARAGTLRAAWNAGQEPGDEVTVTHEVLTEDEAQTFRVSTVALDYVRGGRAPRYDVVLDLEVVP